MVSGPGIKQLDPEKKITIVDTEIHAVQEVLNNHTSGSISVIFADNIKAVVDEVRKAYITNPGQVLEMA